MEKIKKNLKDLYILIGSLKFFITLLIFLTLSSVTGTLLLQKPLEEITPYERYKNNLPQSIIQIMDAIGLFDVFHSIWFISLLVLVVLSIIFCTIEHVKKKTLPKIRLKRNVASVLHLRYRLITEIIKSQYFGVYVTHLSIIIILSGAILNINKGFEGNLVLLEGQTKGSINLKNSSILSLPFQIKCDDFNVEYYGNTTRPQEFTSALKVIENGQVVQDVTIEVNKPLIHRNIYFYQSGYEKAPMGDMVLTVKLKEDPTFHKEATLVEGSSLQMMIKGVSYELRHLGTNNNLQNMGENAQVALFKDGKQEAEFPLFKNYPDFDCQFRAKEGPCLTVNDFKERYFTVLSVGYNPGVPIIWTGCFLLISGITWIFVTFSRKKK